MLQVTEVWNTGETTRKAAYLALLKLYRHNEAERNEAQWAADLTGLNVDQAYTNILTDDLLQLHDTLRLVHNQ